MKTREIVKILKGVMAVWMAWCCLSCDRDYLRYDTNSKDVLYLIGADSNYVSLNEGALVDTGTFRIVVALMGMPEDHERSYKIEVVDSSTTAVKDVHYKFPDLIFPADTVQDYLYITLYRDRDPELKNRPVELAFKLVSSDDFEIIPLNEYKTSVCHLFINYVAIEEPWWWWGVSDILGMYNKEVESKLIELYNQVEQTNPTIYEIWDKACAGDFEQYGVYIFDSRNIDQIPVKKYLLFPLYNYFLEHPEPGVEIPKPKY
ncbi:DUF4843 domain-containing protein [Butyricimonas paravirosa]|uniref:DUF4843 domain-containing protein n=1 Tax=Butyricimonas paravirosa TaxID=1472417 RepID=UPI0021091D2B|nr:DUF4843 domain-containing protein [Butyricimonas paravirosa]MCQ4872761.1 DUF4843 domain-containing protein [Butyricimonas paravirosa]